MRLTGAGETPSMEKERYRKKKIKKGVGVGVGVWCVCTKEAEIHPGSQRQKFKPGNGYSSNIQRGSVTTACPQCTKKAVHSPHH
jgi:hypothetical protein